MTWEREPCESRNSEITAYVLGFEDANSGENVTYTVSTTATKFRFESLTPNSSYSVNIAALYIDSAAMLLGPLASVEVDTLIPNGET